MNQFGGAEVLGGMTRTAGPDSAPAAAPVVSFGRDDAAELCGRLAALMRAGLPAGRIWPVLAEGRGGPAQIAGTVAGMVAVGGSVTEGLRLASARASGSGVEILGWLATTTEVIERSGAPAATVLDGVGAGLLSQLTELDEREIALAGPRATALVLSCLPLAGLVLGLLAGVNPLAVLVGTGVGRASAVVGVLFWLVGRRWSGRLVRATERDEHGVAEAVGSENRPWASPLPAPLLLDLLAAVLEGGAPPVTALQAIAAGLEGAGDGRSRELLLISGRLGDPAAADAAGGLPLGGSGTAWTSAANLGLRTRTAAPAVSSRTTATATVRTRAGPGSAAAVRQWLTAQPAVADRVLVDLEEELLLAIRSGLAPTALIRRAAADARRRRATAQFKAIRRLEVLLVVPAGVCLLPAFILLGVVPLVIGLFRG